MHRFAKIILFYGLSLLFLFWLPGSLSAQPPGPGDPGDCFGSDPMAQCPIDGGVTALLLVGIGYGVKKVRNSRNRTIVS